MVVAEFQQLNPCAFPDGVFVVEPAATLARYELTDDSVTLNGVSSPYRHRIVTRKQWI